MQETRVQSLGWEVPLEKGMAIHSSILAWRIPWTEKPGSLQSVGSPGKDTGVDCHSLLQRNFPTQGSNPGLLHHRQILYHLSYREVLSFLFRTSFKIVEQEISKNHLK